MYEPICNECHRNLYDSHDQDCPYWRPPWNTPEHTDWPKSTEYPSGLNPYHWDHEEAKSEPKE